MGVRHTTFEGLLDAAGPADLGIGRGESATVMFTDIVGSSAPVEAMGDARWTGMVQAHVADLTRVVEAEGGRLVKSLVDGTMSAFPSSGAKLRAARTIQREMAERAGEPRLGLRIGLNTGDVIETDEHVFGTVVNKAARVAAMAGGNEIAVSDTTCAMVGATPDFVFRDPASVSLKGLEGDHVIYRLEWQV